MGSRNPGGAVQGTESGGRMIAMATRKFKRLTNRKILTLFRQGLYRLEDGAVLNLSGKKITIYKCHRGYKWVRLYFKGGRRAVPVHRIIWMLANGRTIPPGHFIHHKRGKEHEHPNDLEALTREQHKAEHRKKDLNAVDEFLSS